MRVRKVQLVDGATVFSMEKFATHEQIDKYTQEYNSLVISLIILLLLSLIPMIVIANILFAEFNRK